jgi:hypothetical protein
MARLPPNESFDITCRGELLAVIPFAVKDVSR